MTKRQSLKLLGELLLNRSNFAIMMKYINSSENLKIMMNLLRGTHAAQHTREAELAIRVYAWNFVC